MYSGKKDKAVRMGKHGREVYKTFEWGEDEEDDPKKILDKFEVYIQPGKKPGRKVQSNSGDSKKENPLINLSKIFD